MEAISVTKLNTYIKQIFDAEELLHNIMVVGEVFGVSLSRNVIYFSLKDDLSSLSCVCFYPNYIDQIKEGDRVVVTGSPSYYTKVGKFNFNVVKIEKVGQGILYEQFLAMKEKLASQGYFDEGHKKPIPKSINRIGVITSREGAVIQDIKNVAWRRNPNVDIVLYNTKVQGNNAENEIAHAIDVMGGYKDIDVIVVARGGGSLEDLWAYNTEIVAKSTYNCPKPIVSAVGHETDFTIIDFVSDLRAPTPSAAAELLTYDKDEILKEIYNLAQNYIKITEKYIKNDEFNVISLQNSFLNGIEKMVSASQAKVQREELVLFNSFENLLNQKYYEIGIIENGLKKENPILILEKGYAKIEQEDKAISSAKAIDLSKNIKVLFKDGQVEAKPLGKGEKK